MFEMYAQSREEKKRHIVDFSLFFNILQLRADEAVNFI